MTATLDKCAGMRYAVGEQLGERVKETFKMSKVNSREQRGIPRFQYKVLRKGGPHQKSNKARRKADKQQLIREVD